MSNVGYWCMEIFDNVELLYYDIIYNIYIYIFCKVYVLLLLMLMRLV